MCDKCDYQEWLERIETLLETEDNSFLIDVYTWVESNKHITPNQKASIMRIEDEQ